MNLTLVGTSRCDVPAREAAGGIIAPLSAARTAQRAVPTRFRVQSAKISWNSSHEPRIYWTNLSCICNTDLSRLDELSVRPGVGRDSVEP